MEFIKIKDKDDLLNKLEHNDGEVVIHYNCSDCDDEQVTYPEESKDQFEILDKYGYFTPHIDCTECGAHTGILSVDYIQGVEVL